mgnify:CR=1 FL=1
MYLKRLENLRSEGAKLARKRGNNAKQQDLVSDIKTEKNIEDYLGVNKIIYFTLDLLCETLTSLNSNITNFEKSVFTGNYIAN